MLRYLLLATLPFFGPPFRPSSPAPKVDEGALEALAEPGPLARIAVIGASASAGFLLPTDLAETLDILLACDHEPVFGNATSRFFLDPFGYAEGQVAAAQAQQPTTVVALDFLFWFSYGLVIDEPYRLRLLESGLRFLERFDCVVLTSTIPDMRASVGKMLTAGQVPRVETLEAINQRIEEWAAERPNVVLVHLPDWHSQFVAGARFEVAGAPWPPHPQDPLLLWDQLHPSIDGLALLSCKILESLVEAREDLDPAAVRLDPQLVATPLRARMRAIMQAK